MKKLLMTTAIVGSLTAAPVFADPTLMIGLSWTFGGGAQQGELGLSGRILSDDKRDEWVGAIGGTYYPGSGKFGIDVGIGYTFTKTPMTLSYDLVNNQALLGLGWADLTDSNTPEVIDYVR
jgi:hypothetical protein